MILEATQKHTHTSLLLMWPGDQAQHLRNNEVVQHSGRLRKVAQNTHQLAVQLGVILPHPVALEEKQLQLEAGQ